MKIKDIALSAAYVGQRVVKAIAVGAQEIWSAVKYIVFADPVVEQICATNWGDGVGITEEQAAAVTDIGEIFRGNTNITSFNELAEFGVTELKERAFQGCTNLKSIRVSPNFVNFGGYCFDGCTNLVGINISEDIEWIGAGCFKGTNITGDIVLNRIQLIGSFAFQGTNIRSLKITSTISYNETFRGGSDCPELVEISAPNAKYIGDFQNTPKLINIGDTSKWENLNGSFKNSNLEGLELDLPSLKSWGLYAGFTNTNIYKIKNLGSITNFYSDVSAANAMFAGCKKLTEATLPATLTKVNNNVFSGCISLKTVVMNAATPPTLGTGVFTSTPSDMTIYVPDQSVQAYREASGWLDYADRIWPMEAYLYGIITFADPAVEAICLANFDTNGSGYISKEEAKAVTSIGTIFQGNTEIVSFDEFNEFLGITSIAFTTFQNCTSLKSINIPPNVTRLENYVFNGCENLESISLPNSLTTIDDGVFTNCKMLENIDIPDSCVNWNGGAQFRYCEKLKSINFPTGMTRIPGYCLDACTSLESVQIPETVTTIGDNALSNTPIEKIDLGANITEIGNYICFACTKLKAAIVRATTPPKSGVNIFYLADCVIYVPDESVDAYKAKENWSTYADRIKPLSEYVEQ